ncbi:hypothetical protein AYJ57_25370 (plasmid) [Salipiger sp. CCB-MM3]|uniref:glycosyltransferase n=1 Tax=Salipiger sp. CCB-MM3 TaxID=1792508 RepID=UPI00080AA6F4|nr:glycosyltransferase [Salipiger sp. CCB-MM3]ANT63807.1 hypothetical protein AYJ57_25370 [Salipiger sp. CCB-MM3]
MTEKQGRAGRVVAVVVTYNRLEKLQVTLARLLQSPLEVLQAILVVDNASTDETAAWLAGQNDLRLTIHRCETNTGGAGGFETGMRLAVDYFDPDWVLVMDDDGRPEPGTLELFHAEDRACAEAWAAAVYHPDGRICDMNRPWLNPFWHHGVFLRTIFGKGRDGFHLGREEYEAGRCCDIDGTSFVGLFVSRAAIARGGYPDGSLFIYGDDVLYTLGITKAGGRIVFDPTLRFEHDFSSMTEADRRFSPLWKSYYHYRNLLMVYRLVSGPFFVFVLPAVTFKWLFKIRFHGGERRAFLSYLLRALRDGLLRRTEVGHAEVMNWVRRS